MSSKSRRLKQLENEIKADPGGETENDFTEEEEENAQELLEEGLEAGEEWAEDYLEIMEKLLEEVDGEPFENLDKLTESERERFFNASRHLFIQ